MSKSYYFSAPLRIGNDSILSLIVEASKEAAWKQARTTETPPSLDIETLVRVRMIGLNPYLDKK
jgi:hypothetical protein